VNWYKGKYISMEGSQVFFNTIYTQNSLPSNTLLRHHSTLFFHHRLLLFKPDPHLSYRFCPSIPLPISTTYILFLNTSFQTFLIPSPVLLSSKCDTRSFHLLANTSSKPLVPLVWFVNIPETSPMYPTVRSYTPLLQLPYFPTISKPKRSLSSLPVW